MKFTTPLHIEGTPEQLKVVEEGLIKLGYRMAHPIGLQKNRIKTKDILGTFEFWYSSSEKEEDQIIVSASNPDLVLALAAMTDDPRGVKGEWVVYEDYTSDLNFDPREYVTKGCLYQLGGRYYNQNEGGFFIKCDNQGNPNGSKNLLYRKAKKEEIIKHFTMKTQDKEIIGYKLVMLDCKAAASKLCGDYSFHLFNGYNVPHSNRSVITSLKQAGVLDLWFEPVYKEDKKVITLRHAGGTFDVEVSKEGIYYAPDNVFLAPEEISSSFRTSFAVRKGGLSGNYTFKASHIDSGCMKAVPVEDWKKVLDTYDSMK